MQLSLEITVARDSAPLAPARGIAGMVGLSRAATADEIVRIVGPLDDAVMMRLLETGATAVEVLEGFSWATADDAIGTELARRPRGAAARVYEILKGEEPEPDEPS